MPNRAVYPIRNGVADAEGYSALLMIPSAFPEGYSAFLEGYSAFPEGYSAVVEQPSRNTRRANEVRGEAKRPFFAHLLGEMEENMYFCKAFCCHLCGQQTTESH